MISKTFTVKILKNFLMKLEKLIKNFFLKIDYFIKIIFINNKKQKKDKKKKSIYKLYYVFWYCVKRYSLFVLTQLIQKRTTIKEGQNIFDKV